MTGITTTLNPVNDGIILVLFIVGIIVSARTRIPRQTIKDLQDVVKAQGDKIKILEDGRIADAKTIGILEGQVQIYKEVPLREWATSIKEVAMSNQETSKNIKAILAQLKTNASIAAEDRDVLTNQNLHIQNEVDKKMAKK